mmetsp:Transcript_13203/g.39911  ORF Transcript_13203/g.39911 Transcript_13203/m.39911 type:complete len:328 (-) Transcript_13203:693-1676(-)
MAAAAGRTSTPSPSASRASKNEVSSLLQPVGVVVYLRRHKPGKKEKRTTRSARWKLRVCSGTSFGIGFSAELSAGHGVPARGGHGEGRLLLGPTVRAAVRRGGDRAGCGGAASRLLVAAVSRRSHRERGAALLGYLRVLADGVGDVDQLLAGPALLELAAPRGLAGGHGHVCVRLSPRLDARRKRSVDRRLVRRPRRAARLLHGQRVPLQLPSRHVAKRELRLRLLESFLGIETHRRRHHRTTSRSPGQRLAPLLLRPRLGCHPRLPPHPRRPSEAPGSITRSYNFALLLVCRVKENLQHNEDQAGSFASSVVEGETSFDSPFDEES